MPSRPRRSTVTCSARSASAALGGRRWPRGASPRWSSSCRGARARDGLGLSASDIDLYRTCPLKYKFARVFAIPQEPTINQRFGILIHNVLERFHAEEIRVARGAGARMRRRNGAAPRPRPGHSGQLDRLLALFEAGWRRQGFGASDDELQYRDRAVAALARYQERHERSSSRPVWLERNFAFTIGPHQLRGSRRPRRPPSRRRLRVDRLQDRRPGFRSEAERRRAARRLPDGAREAWRIEAGSGSYWYVLADERVSIEAEPDDAERVERTVLEVAAGITDQDFEPRPSHEICSWCDYRLICPASEA